MFMFFKRPINLIVVLCFTILCFVIVNITTLIGKLSINNEIGSQYKYNIEHHFSVMEYSEDQKADYLEAVYSIFDYLENEDDVNAFICDLILRISNYREQYTSTVVMNLNQTPELINTSGKIISLETGVPNAVIISEELAPLAENNKITVGKNEYNVIDVCAIDTMSQTNTYNKNIIILWNTFDETHRVGFINSNFEMIRYGFTVKYCSNKDSVFEKYEKALVHISENYYIDDGEADSDKNPHEEFFLGFLMILYVLSLGFSVICVVYISIYWVFKRREELAIKFAFGYTFSQVYMELAIDNIKIAFCSFCSYMLIQSAIILVPRKDIIDIHEMISKSIFTFISIILISLLNSILMTLYSAKKVPVYIIRKI